MLNTVALLLMFAADPAVHAPSDELTLPRHVDSEKAVNRALRDDEPTDPLFDRPQVATDDPAFILAAVESARQGVIDARDAAGRLDKPELRVAAEKIGAQYEQTTRRLENVAQLKGWRLPGPNPGRTAAVPAPTPTRTNANFIVNQISSHENTVAQYRAQIAGKGDADLRKILRESVRGYQQNLDLLLTLKP